MADNVTHREGLDRIQLYTDATYTYICEAAPAVTLSMSRWRIRRYTTTSVEWCQGRDSYSFAATDLATVQALFA